MKQKIGELNGKQIMVSANPEDITYNEYLFENTDNGIILKQRDINGKLVEVTNTISNTNTYDSVDVIIEINSTIKGPSKWFKGSNYLFYINKNDKFVITDADTGEIKTNIASLVATGKTDKVYEIKSNQYSSIEIKEE